MKRQLVITAAVLLLGCAAAFAQKKVSILGDSYSTFQGYVTPGSNDCWYFGNGKNADSRNTLETVEQTWWYRLVHGHGMELDVNNSWSGTTVCLTGYRSEDASDRAFITRMFNLGNPDIILVFGGTNDSWAGSPVGEYRYKDWKKADLYAFRPAFAYMLHSLQRLYPDTEVYCITNSELSDAITGSIDTICRHYGVKNIMLHDIHKQGGHPSAEGMESISRQVWDAISGN